MRQLIFWCCILCLAGCASLNNNLNRVYLSPSVAMDSLSIPTALQNQEQLVFVTFQGEDNYSEFLVASSFQTNQVSMVFMTVEGFPLAEFTYGESGAITQKDYLPAIKLRPDYIMANLQLILWPVDLLNGALDGAVITESNDQRELTADDKLLMAIQYDDKTTRIRNMLQDYTMTITEVETQ